jgi:hypothetical protein
MNGTGRYLLIAVVGFLAGCFVRPNVWLATALGLATHTILRYAMALVGLQEFGSLTRLEDLLATALWMMPCAWVGRSLSRVPLQGASHHAARSLLRGLGVAGLVGITILFLRLEYELMNDWRMVLSVRWHDWVFRQVLKHPLFPRLLLVSAAGFVAENLIVIQPESATA